MRLISRCALIGIYSVCTVLIEQVLKTGSECALVREYNNAKIWYADLLQNHEPTAHCLMQCAIFW